MSPPSPALTTLAGVLAITALSLAFPIFVTYLLDRRNHEGVDWFARRRILRHGRPASAVVLSSTLIVGRATGSRYNGAYSIVYEVRPIEGAPFRSRGVEVMYFSEARANLEVGRTVEVRYDPASGRVVLVRVSADRLRAAQEEERRAKEERLLRG